MRWLWRAAFSPQHIGATRGWRAPRGWQRRGRATRGWRRPLSVVCATMFGCTYPPDIRLFPPRRATRLARGLQFQICPLRHEVGAQASSSDMPSRRHEVGVQASSFRYASAVPRGWHAGCSDMVQLRHEVGARSFIHIRSLFGRGWLNFAGSVGCCSFGFPGNLKIR